MIIPIKPSLEDTKELNEIFNNLNITSFSANIQHDGSTYLSFDRELNNTKKEAKIDLPEKYDIKGDVTTLFWKDGTQTTVKRCEDDEFNPRLAFLTAFFQKYSGMSKNKANKYLSRLNFERKEKLVQITKESYYPLHISFLRKNFPRYVDNFKPLSSPNKNKVYSFIGEKEDVDGSITALIQNRETGQVYIVPKRNIKDYKPKHAKEEN